MISLIKVCPDKCEVIRTSGKSTYITHSQMTAEHEAFMKDKDVEGIRTTGGNIVYKKWS